MDPFAEKDLIDCLKAISATLNNIDTRIEELTQAVREIALKGDVVEEEFGEAVIEDEPEDSEKDII
jgi:hypothetical protein